MKHNKQKIAFANYLLEKLTDLTLKHDLHLITTEKFDEELTHIIQDTKHL